MPNPEVDPESIEATLQELEAEGIEMEGRPKPAEVKVEEPKEEPKPEPKKEEHKDDALPPKEEKPKEEPKPELWRQRVAEKHREKEIQQLAEKRAEEIVAAKAKEKPAPDTSQTTDEIDTLANELTEGVEDEAQRTAQKTVIKRIIEAAAKQANKNAPAALPDEIKALIERSREQEAEQQFLKEFDDEVRPLVEKEYGPVSDEQLRTLKTQIQSKILSDPRLIQAPLSLVYAGSPEFRGIAKEAKRSAEPSRPGQGRATEVVDFENMTEDKFSRLSDEDQDRYVEYQQAKKRT